MFRFVLAVAFVACTEQVRLGVDPAVGDGSPDAGGAAGSAAAGAGNAAGGGAGLFPSAGSAGSSSASGDAGPCVPADCGPQPRQCGDCQDNDGDGRVDASDPECLGPCDDSESELSTGTLARVNGSCRADCYFDRNAGSGDDGCSWSYRCDPLSIAPDYAPTGVAQCEFDAAEPSCSPSSSQQSACEAGCLPLTPNGCDCFGCCELPAGSGSFVWLGSDAEDAAHCEIESLADPARCRPCTPVPSCQNRCEECELCVGKRELPASCNAGAGPACPAGVRTCDPDARLDCGLSEYCITGCCVPLPR